MLLRPNVQCAGLRAVAAPRRRARWPFPSRGAGRHSFATTAFTVPAHNKGPEHTLFVVGLNEGKFFGQDGAEEGLKLLERVVEHHQEYELLLGFTEKELAEIEQEHKVKNQRLTPSRDLEGNRNCEVIPMVQAATVDKFPRRALGRPLKTTQGHVAWQLWKHPREAVKLYWEYWRRKEYKNAARQRHWSRVFPVCAHAYFDERAEVVALRAVDSLAQARSKGRGGATVLAVPNELFSTVSEQLGSLLGSKEVAQSLGSPKSEQYIRGRLAELCADVPDLTPVLIFVYLGLPIALVQFLVLGIQHYLSKTGLTSVFEEDRRE